MSNAPKHATCKNCGTSDVTWRQTKAGKWYLADVNHGIRGSVYYSAHYLTCTERGPRADRLRAITEHNAKVEAERAQEAAESAVINARMLEMIKAGMSSEEIVAAIYGEFGKAGGK